MKPQKHDVLPNRLESIQQEHARQEKIRKENEERKRKEERINFKLERFSLTEIF